MALWGVHNARFTSLRACSTLQCVQTAGVDSGDAAYTCGVVSTYNLGQLAVFALFGVLGERKFSSIGERELYNCVARRKTLIEESIRVVQCVRKVAVHLGYCT
jgi:hypothetical protein